MFGKLLGFFLKRGAEGSTWGGISIASILAYFFNIEGDPETLKQALQGPGDLHRGPDRRGAPRHCRSCFPTGAGTARP